MLYPEVGVVLKSLAHVLQAAQLLSQTSEFQLLMWLQWWDS